MNQTTVSLSPSRDFNHMAAPGVSAVLWPHLGEQPSDLGARVGVSRGLGKGRGRGGYPGHGCLFGSRQSRSQQARCCLTCCGYLISVEISQKRHCSKAAGRDLPAQTPECSRRQEERAERHPGFDEAALYGRQDPAPASCLALPPPGSQG